MLNLSANLRMPRIAGAASGIAALAAVLVVSSGLAYADDAHTTHAVAAPRNVAVTVGAESSDMALQLNSFLPGPIDVNVGDTVTWHVASTEFHTVSFLSGAAAQRFEAPTPDGAGLMVNPVAAFPLGGSAYDGTGLASSGILNKDQTYSLTFTQPGVFEYLCLVHPDMKGEIHVNAEAAPGAPRTVAAGAGANNASLMRFVPGDVEIHAGETVAFTNQDTGMMPHTVSFKIEGVTPEVIVPQPQPAGPPLLVLNPDVIAPHGAPGAFDGREYLNSGMLVHDAPGQPFAVTFTKPGVYNYVCLLHENMGMRGTITVLP